MEKNTSLLRYDLSKKIESLSLGKDDLKEFCDLLQEKSNEAAELEIAAYSPVDSTPEQIESDKKILKDSHELRVSLKGDEGEHLYGTISEVFGTATFPDHVVSIVIDSGSVLKTSHNYYVRNSFNLYIDFRRNSIWDFSLLPSQPTPTESKLSVSGYDSSWVNGTYSQLTKFIEKRQTSMTFLHKFGVYDIFLYTLAIPVAFWCVNKSTPLLSKIFATSHSLVSAAAYLYLFVATLFAFRIVFHYARWVFPLIEFRSPLNKPIKHRLFLSVLVTGWIGSFIYDIVKAIL